MCEANIYIVSLNLQIRRSSVCSDLGAVQFLAMNGELKQEDDEYGLDLAVWLGEGVKLAPV